MADDDVAPPPFVRSSQAPKTPVDVPVDTPAFARTSQANQPKPPAAPGADEEHETFTIPTEIGPGIEIRTPPRPKYDDHPTLMKLPVDQMTDPGQRASIGLGLAMPGTVEGRTNILKKHLPGATFENDQYGNPLVIHEGKKYHIDRPDWFNDQSVAHGAMSAVPTIATTAAAAAVPGAGPFLAAGELFMGGYLGHQLRTYLGRQAGSQAEQDLTNPDAIVEGAVNAILPGAGSMMRSAGQGVRAGVKRVLSPRQATEEALTKAHPDDLYFHTAPDNAAELVRSLPYTRASGTVEKAAADHAAAAPARVAQGLDQTFGPADASIKTAIDTVKGPASADLTALLNQAKPIDIAPLIARIDQELLKTTPDMPTARALIKFKKMLTEQEATPASGFTRKAVPGTAPGRPAIYHQVPGQPGTPVQYVSDPAMLNTIKREFDNVLKFGDKDLPARTVSATDYAVGGVRQDLSKLLNDNVPGYEPIMARYRTAYDMADAYDAGQKIMTGGKNALTLEEVLPYLQNNPAEAEGFRIGVRDAMDAVIRTAADGKDVAAVKKILSGENSYRREILNTMYGKEAIDNLVTMAEREGNYAGVNQMMIDAAQQGKAMAGIAKAAKVHEAPFGNVQPYATLYGTTMGTLTKGLGWITSRLRGSHGKQFERDLGELLTSPAGPALESLLGKTKSGMTTGSTATSALPAPIVEGYQPDRRPQYRATGGRTGYKLDCVGRAAKLCREADAIRKKHAGQTEVILHAPDDAVATALALAGRGV